MKITKSGFSLIEMMIAIVILGLGLVMTATMFPVAWTRARSLTEYTTQRVIAQSAAATIEESLRPSGSSFFAFTQAGTDTGKYFLATGSLAGDVFYDPVLHNDPILRAPCNGPNDCWTHLSVLIPSDTRVHALHMSNLGVSGAGTQLAAEEPFKIERMRVLTKNGLEEEWLCETDKNPPVCSQSIPDGDFPAKCANPNPPVPGEPYGARFCSRSFFTHQVSLGARMYPPMEEPPPASADPAALATWSENFGTHRFTWAALHRLRNYVGPDYEDVEDVFGTPPATPLVKARFAEKAATASGTTRVFDFYIVTLKRPQASSRYAPQDSISAPEPFDRSKAFKPLPLDATRDVALPVPWRVQVEFPALTFGNPPTGVPTEVQVPPTKTLGSPEENAILAGMFPTGTQFVDEVTGQIYRVTRRRTNATEMAFLTLDREVLPRDLDDSGPNQEPGASGLVDAHETLRTVWMYPPPIAERIDDDKVLFDDSTPVVGIDVKAISLSPPG